MIQKTRGIVLNHIRYGETSAIIHVFTQTFGMQSYMVNGVYGSKKRDKALLLQPLNRLDMEVYHKAGKEILRIKEFRLVAPLQVIPYSQARRAQAFLITELLARVLRSESGNAHLFSFIEESIETLDSGKEGLGNFHLFFLFYLTRFLGFFPHNNHSGSMPFFDLQEACFISDEPSHPYFLNPGDALVFLRLFQCDQEQFASLAVNVNERRMLLNALVTFYDLHFGGAGNLRSLDVLSTLFQE
jgi:DNA repair protein RecO (recombination protein O)